jgi:hypothetical protein
MEEGMQFGQAAISEDFVEHEHQFEDADAPVQTDAARDAWAAGVIADQDYVLQELPG